MSAPSEKLAKLRHLLAERYPAAPRTVGQILRTGLPALDEVVGGLPQAAVTEIVCATASCGGHLLLAQLLAITRTARQRVALVDANDSFDPDSYPPDLLAHLLWVRCPAVAAALSAADLLTRDANLGLVVLDLRHAGESELRRTPSTFWYRLQRAVESTDLALVIETARPMIPSAQLRLRLATPHSFNAVDRERPALIAELTPAVQRQRLAAAAG
jgi:hypothetical protein